MYCFSFIHYYLSPDKDLAPIKQSIVKADIQHTLVLTSITMLVRNVFELYFSISCMLDRFSTVMSDSNEGKCILLEAKTMGNSEFKI
jgi:hypothetical protein